ncbi:MAG: two-component system chemotaxis response regulator CheB [Flavobacteriales bacterium]
MAYKVLIVDDSSFFQMRLKDIVNEHPDLQVVGVASNGQEAIDLEDSLRPDVISMDYEMPLMDGITAIKTLMQRRPIPIIMFSSMTYEGARITLDALDAGAVDFMPKNFAEVSRDSVNMKKKLHEKLLTFARKAKPMAGSSKPLLRPASSQPIQSKLQRNSNLTSPLRRKKSSLKGRVKILLIGASTGGPVAVTDIITKLPVGFPLPIIVIQHMPENFTRAFSERMNRQSALSVKEAETGDVVKPGHVYVAPGGKQLMFEKNGKCLKIIQGDDRVNYKPCIDITFASAAGIYGDSILGIILTGMGADGCEGSRLLKQKGSSIWAQDKNSCVVYGMPAAVKNAGLVDAEYSAGEFSQALASEF